MTRASLSPELLEDIRQVAEQLGSAELSRSEYLQHGRFSAYQIYDGGTTWEDYCVALGLASRKKEHVLDDVYFSRLRTAVEVLGRLPKAAERKRFGLNFSKSRYSTLPAFLAAAAEAGVIDLPNPEAVPQPPAQTGATEAVAQPTRAASSRAVPPIPRHTSRRSWERTGINGFPYAPQDESGTVALFAILCALGRIQWDILELNAGKGIDSVCWDHVMQRELRVEIKYLLSKAGWNHSIDALDYVVCWQNRWPAFPKPVLSLSDVLAP
jgi:hypothetical protein